MTASISSVFKYISYIIKKYSYNIAMLRMGDKYEYFIYSMFEPSQSGGSATIDFCAMRGIAITDFIANANFDLQTNSRAFDSLLENQIRASEEVYIKFNKNIDYLMFSS